MDVGSMLYNSLKDVTWSTTTLPLDRLVGAYRLPQIVKLDSGKLSFSVQNKKRKEKRTDFVFQVVSRAEVVVLIRFISLLGWKRTHSLSPQRVGGNVTRVETLTISHQAASVSTDLAWLPPPPLALPVWLVNWTYQPGFKGIAVCFCQQCPK